MESIVMYLLYVLGIVSVVIIMAFTHVKVKSIDTKYDMLRMLVENDYETENIDLEKFIK